MKMIRKQKDDSGSVSQHFSNAMLPAVFSFTHKVCPICGKRKPVADYHVYFSKQRNKHRIGNYCKPCARMNSNERAAEYFRTHKDQKLQYARDYRANPKNKEKLQKLSSRFKVKYREELQDCYVRDLLNQRCGIPNYVSKELPEIVEAKRLQIKIKRKIKSLKNGKE